MRAREKRGPGAVLALASATAAALLPACGGPQARGGSAGPGESLSPEAVRVAVEAHQDEVRACYERRATERPGLEGRVDVRMTITVEGEVAEAEVAEDTAGDAELASCVLGVVRAIRFPAATAASVVTYPIALDPAAAAGAPAPEIDGSLSPEGVLEVVRGHVAEVRACYEAALGRSAETRGRVVVAFTVTPGGAVEGASAAEDTTGDAELASCVVAAVSAFAFPGAAAPTSVRYPFVLMPGEGGGGPPPATPDGVRAAVAARSAELERCRQGTTGQVDVRFTIGTDGVVRAVEALANTTGDDDVALCVLAVIQGLAFEPGSEGTTITLPLAIMPPAD